MNINKWLADTAVAVQSAAKPEPGYPDETSPSKNTPVLDLPFSKRRAKRRKDVSKDSSILASEDIPTEVPARRVVRQAHQHSVDSVSSEDVGHSVRREDEDDNSANPYQRRKRHKTKADRYDPKPQKPNTKQQDGGKQKRKSTKKDKEAKRSKKDKSAPAAVRNFHAANVPCERLTLQPRSNVGIFKKGKASSPFRGRGRGLPDLAFSEMNFLRKRRHVANDVADTDESYKTRKKDKKRATEEEISSYFAPKRPPLLERSQNDAQPPRAAARNGTRHDDSPQRQSSTVPSIRTTTEKPVLPELVDTNRGSRSTSNTYFAWSDSLRHFSRPAIVRAASTTDLEAYRAVSASTPFTGMKVRASSYDIRPPDLAEHQRRPTRGQITWDSRSNFGDAKKILDHAASTATPSRIHLNQRQELDLERTKSASDELRPTAKESASNAGLESIARTGRPPAQEIQQQNPILSDSTRIPQDVVSAPVLEGGDATSTSIANLLTECETAFLRSTRTRSPRLHLAILDHRTRSRSTNDASTTRQGHFVPQGLSQQFDENPDEEALYHEQEGPFLVGSNQQIHDPRMPELQYYDTYEPSEAEETVGYMCPDTMEYQERVPLQPTVMPTQWPRYETQYNHVVQFRPRDEIPMSDLEDDALEQLEFAGGEEEEDNGLAGFWRPNMLY